MPSFAAAQVARLETLLSQCVGVQSITVDGQTVTYADLLAQYQFWKRRAAVENGTRPFVSQINLGNFR
ncbi:MAG: hypothetical protein KGL39_22610 [Patescibacteria group bacterium]|nr:hypothetical protein [Patescibacteria group bacterium]